MSGELDEATISLMKKPRCGMADPVEEGRRVRRYATNGEWRKNHLTYFVQHGYDLPNVSSNPLHPNIKMQILHSILYTFPLVLSEFF